MMPDSRQSLFLLLAAAAALSTHSLAAPPTPTTVPASPHGLIRLSSNEFIGLATVCRVINRPDGSIDVTLATGSGLHLAHPGDVRLVTRGLRDLQAAGRAFVFEPVDGVMINLDQVTNVWNNAAGFTFWGTNGDAWELPGDADKQGVWTRLLATAKEAEPAVRLVKVSPSLLINARHVGHVSRLNSELRFFMSNKTWPIIESTTDADTAMKVLHELAAHE